MYIGYSNRKLEQICTNPTKAYKHLSNRKLVRILIMRLNQLTAWKTLSQVPHTPPVNRHKLKGGRKDEWAVSIRDPYRICFKAVGDFQIDASGKPLLHTVTEIEITFIGDYHNG